MNECRRVSLFALMVTPSNGFLGRFTTYAYMIAWRVWKVGYFSHTFLVLFITGPNLRKHRTWDIQNGHIFHSVDAETTLQETSTVVAKCHKGLVIFYRER